MGADRSEIDEARRIAEAALSEIERLDPTTVWMTNTSLSMLARAFLDLLGKQSERGKALADAE